MTNSPRVVDRDYPHRTAEKFKAEERPTLINYEEEFLAYDGEGAYRLIKDGTVASEVQSYFEDAETWRNVNNKRKLVKFNPKNSDTREVVGALERQNHVAPGTIEPPFFLPGDVDDEGNWSAFDPRDMIACRNGLLQISTRKLYNSTSRFFTRTALPIEYDKAARPVRWLSFLAEVLDDDAELILLVQQMFGYLITSETKYQKIFYLRGISNSGKSTLMRVLDALIGERNICNATIRGLADKNTLNDMTGATLCKTTDMNTDDRSDVGQAASIMNAISGEDPVHVFRKFKDGINVKMRVRFLLSGNQFPNFGEHATALARRLLVLPFNVSFEGDKADPDLSATLIAELPGILNWSLDGLENLRSAGKFIEPAASLEAKAEILNSGDAVRSFVAEDCELGPDFEVNKMGLFRRYQLHCQKIGAKVVLSYPGFNRNIKTHYNGVRPARPGSDGDREQAMVGIRLKDEAEPVPFIAFRLDPEMVELMGEPCTAAILRNADGKPVVYSTASADFDDDD